MSQNKSFFKQMPWSWNELISMLVLVLILIPIFIETLLLNYLTEVFQNNLHSGTLVGFIMSIIFTVGLYLVALRPKNLSWYEVGLGRFPKSYFVRTLGWTLLLIIATIVLSYILEFLFQISVENSKTESMQANLSTVNIVIAFVSAAVISPIYEEIFYRGFLYRWFRSKLGVMAGMMISSFIFTIVHIPTYNTLPYTFVSGMIFAWTYEKTASIYPAMIIHALFNGLSVILTVTL